jgi:hypothetical protein
MGGAGIWLAPFLFVVMCLRDVGGRAAHATAGRAAGVTNADYPRYGLLLGKIALPGIAPPGIADTTLELRCSILAGLR